MSIARFRRRRCSISAGDSALTTNLAGHRNKGTMSTRLASCWSPGHCTAHADGWFLYRAADRSITAILARTRSRAGPTDASSISGTSSSNNCPEVGNDATAGAAALRRALIFGHVSARGRPRAGFPSGPAGRAESCPPMRPDSTSRAALDALDRAGKQIVLAFEKVTRICSRSHRGSLQDHCFAACTERPNSTGRAARPRHRAPALDRARGVGIAI